jgi:hypothetical protein
MSKLIEPKFISPDMTDDTELDAESSARISGDTNLQNQINLKQDLPKTYLITAIQSTSSQTHTDITQFVSASLAVGTYRVRSMGKVLSSSTNNGFGFRVQQGTATISNYVLDCELEQVASGTSQDYNYKQIAANVNITSASVPSTTVPTVFDINGYITISSAGTIKMQFRSELATQSVAIQIGSIFTLEKVL